MDTFDVTPEAWLDAYGAAFGRMCVLAARASNEGAGEHRIRMAMEGRGRDYYADAGRLEAIRVARRHLVTLQKQAHVCGVSGRTQAIRRQQILQAISGEWETTVPDLGAA
jgi:hypothetical protein